jgi:hypothetical protein
MFFGGSAKQNYYHHFLNKDDKFKDTENILIDDATVIPEFNKNSNIKLHKKSKARGKINISKEIIVPIVVVLISALIIFIFSWIWDISIKQGIQDDKIGTFQKDVEKLEIKNDEMVIGINQNITDISVINEFKKNIEKEINSIKVKLKLP